MGAILAWSILQIRPNLATKVMIISEGHRTSLRKLNSAETLIRSGISENLFKVENYHIMRRYLQKRHISAIELEDIIDDLKLKDDLNGRVHTVC